MPDLNALANTVRQVRWDTPYRVLASLAGLAAFFAGTPLEGARAVTSWLGFSVAANLAAAERWLIDPARRNLLFFVCILVVLVAAVSLWWHGEDGLSNWESRAGATLALAYAILLQLQLAAWLRWAIPLFILGLAMLWFSLALLGLALFRQYCTRAFAVAWDTVIGFGWAPLFMFGWALLPGPLVPVPGDAQPPSQQTALRETSGPTGIAR